MNAYNYNVTINVTVDANTEEEAKEAIKNYFFEMSGNGTVYDPSVLFHTMEKNWVDPLDN